jgi:hypothetical protein
MLSLSMRLNLNFDETAVKIWPSNFSLFSKDSRLEKNPLRRHMKL